MAIVPTAPGAKLPASAKERKFNQATTEIGRKLISYGKPFTYTAQGHAELVALFHALEEVQADIQNALHMELD